MRTAALEADLVACAGIAPSIDAKTGITDGVRDAVPQCPVLVVIGANDEQVSPARAREWADQVGATFEEMAGANHFFWAKYEELTELVCNWLDERIT